MRIKEFNYYMCDFETTVYDDQAFTEVWAAALVPFYTEDVKIFHSIGEFLTYVFKFLEGNVCLYFHNLKFDGFFILSYIMDRLHWEPAITKDSDPDTLNIEWIPEYRMRSRTYQYMITERGQFYKIVLKQGKRFIEIRDSLKLLPFSVKEIGKSFETKHKKLDMEYKGFRYAGCPISEKEAAYIRNDVLVVKEALEIAFAEGHNKLTIGGCCFAEFKKLLGINRFTEYFPDLTAVKLDPEQYGTDDADKYIRKSYKGGWCYLVPEKADTIYRNGITADVNSLYPYVMSGSSGSLYPIGAPTFWTGEIPEEALEENHYFFVRIRTRFYLKKDKLPTIQIKNNYLYRSTEWLETSDIVYQGVYHRSYTDLDGEEKPAVVTLTLTCTDFYLFLEHYDLEDFEILDGCWFKTAFGIFDDYINKYKKIKMESKGARRTLAKLFLNNLYGKMATSRDSSWKYCILKEDGSIAFLPVAEYNKKTVYIPVGSAITSYARNYTIRAAQANYRGKDKPGFIYADTDSIHCDIPKEELQGCALDDKEFGCWDLEREWNQGLFVRQKTYIEITGDDYNIKCAGMPDPCKYLLNISITGKRDKEYLKKITGDEDYLEKLTEEEKKFVLTKRELSDFKRGLAVPGKLLPKRIPGGIVLIDTVYEMR